MADSNTIIGESILIKGNLEGNEDLTIQGRVEGSINLTKTLLIESSGVVKAEVSTSNAVVSGVMVGNLSATDSVELTESGRMVGDIRAPRVIINEGAAFKGQVDMGDLEMPRMPTSTKPPTYRPAPMRTSSAPPRREPASKPMPRPEPRPELVKPAPAKKPVVVQAAQSKKKKVVVRKKH